MFLIFIDSTALFSIKWTVQEPNNIDWTHLALLDSTTKILFCQAKMKTVEEQHADYQKHISVLKESLIAKEEHYNMLQLDVSSF